MTDRDEIWDPATEVLLLRTCAADGGSRGGYRWPLEVGACATAPDWDPQPRCGGGLHGLLWGEGDGGLLAWDEEAVWLVVAAVAAEVVDLGGKAKVPRARVVHVGDRRSATDLMMAARPGAAVVGGQATAGDGGQATAGEGGTATAGYLGQATAGDGGQATAGDGGTAAAGHYGTAAAGYHGTAAAGDGGTLVLRWWNGHRSRVAVAYVGEDGIEPDVPYRLDGEGRFVRVDYGGKEETP